MSEPENVVEEWNSTFPKETNIAIDGPFETQEDGRKFGWRVYSAMRIIGKSINLASLDGITISSDYLQALASLDRGKDGLAPLSASSLENDGVLGVAMAPAVLRRNVIKTHLIFNTNYLLPLADDDSELFPLALHTLAHECSHVMIHEAFDQAFPGVILQKKSYNFLDRFRFDVFSACWNEYGATRLSATWGEDPLSGYLDTFNNAYENVEENANAAIRSYRHHGDMDELLNAVMGAYGTTLKWFSYLAGTMHGQGRSINDLPELSATIDQHWLGKHLRQLEGVFQDIWSKFGLWEEMRDFEKICDIACAILDEGGLKITKEREDHIHVNVPHSPSTTPNYEIAKLLGLI